MAIADLIETQELRFTKGERLNIAPSGKRFFAKFIEPGLVSYTDCGGDMELLRKETIDDAINSALGNPLTMRHVPTDLPVEELKRVSRGDVDRVGYDSKDGWYFCEGPVTDEYARDKLRRGAQVSCGYRVLEFGPGGMHHNVPYAREITKIKFHHLAIVDNPRYEGADIRLNSKKETPAMFKWFKKKIVPATADVAAQTVEESGELAADSTIEIDGKQVRMNEVVDAHQKAEAEKARIAKEAAAPRLNEMSGDDEVEIDGKRVKMNSLIECFRAHGFRSNESAEDKVKRENAIAEKARTDAAEAARTNGRESFRVLSSARNVAAVVTERANSANTEQEQLERGRERYGSTGRN